MHCYNHEYINEKQQRVLLTTHIDAKGNVSETEYDAHHRVYKVTLKDAFGAILHQQEITYDIRGNKQNIFEKIYTPGKDDVRSILNACVYDSMNRLKYMCEAVGTPEQKTTEFDYTIAGEKSTIKRDDGINIHYQYDTLGRLSCLWSTDNTIHYVYKYDRNDNLIEVTDKIHNTKTKRVYNVYNQIIKEQLANQHEIHRSYDLLGRVTQIILSDDTTIDYAYDAWNLKEVTRPAYTHHYTRFDEQGHLTNATLPTGQQLIYSYDLLGRKETTQTPHYKEKLTYDAISNILSKETETPEQTLTNYYTYDGLSQLTSENGTTQNEYLYDSLHNRISKNGKSHAYNALNQLLSDGENTYTYDRVGNVKECRGHAGNTLYHYDALNRLTKVETPTQIVIYSYDALNRRLSKTVDNQTTFYLYDNQNEIGATQNGAVTELRVLGNGRGAENGATIAIELKDKIYYTIHDNQGNIIQLLNTDGSLYQYYNYSAYGEEDTPRIIPWGYSSKRYDPETGLYYFGERYYMPSLGRWLTQDPIGDKDSANLYAYVSNNPLSLFDLYGNYGTWDPLDDPGYFQAERNYELNTPLQDSFITRDYIHDPLAKIGVLPSLPHVREQQFESDFIARFGERTEMGYVSGWTTRKFRPVWTNGINNTYEEASLSAQLISKISGGMRVDFVYNGSKKIIFDTIEAKKNLSYIATEPVLALRTLSEKIAYELDPDGTIELIGHSQGCAHTTLHLLTARKEIQQMTNVLAIAPAMYIYDATCRSCTHVVTKGDPVPYFDIRGAIRQRHNTIVLKSHTSWGLFDHSFNSSTYHENIYHFIDRAKKFHNVKDPHE